MMEPMVGNKVSPRTEAIRLPMAMPLVGGVECRAGGPEQIILVFNEPILAADGTPDGTEVSLSAGTLEIVSIDGPLMTVEMGGVPDLSCQTITVTGLQDLTGNPLTGDNQAHVGVLAGDVNRALAVERERAGKQLVEHYTEGVDV